jgi:hypothetical protein
VLAAYRGVRLYRVLRTENWQLATGY